MTQPNDLASAPSADHGHHDLVVLSLAFFFIFLGPAATQQFVIPYVASQNGMSHTACSWVLASLYLSAVVWRLLCGYTLHWFGAKWAIELGLCTYAGFAACAYFFPNFWALVAAAIVWGWGAAAIWVTGPTRILESQSELKRGRASGFFYSAVFLGQALGVFFLGQIKDERLIFGTAALIGLLGMVTALFLRPHKLEAQQPQLFDVFSMMRGMRGVVMCGILLTASMGFGIVLSPLTSAVTATKGFGKISALAIGFYVARLAVSWVAGWLTDRVGRVWILSACFFIGAMGLAVAASSTASAALALAAVALGVQAGIMHIPIMALVGDSVEPERRHLAFGALYAWSNLGISMTIVFGQFLREALGGNRGTFGVFAGVMVVCALLALVAGRGERPTE